MKYDLISQISADIAKLQARIFELERKVKVAEQTEQRLRSLERSIEDFGIKIRSVQEESGSF